MADWTLVLLVSYMSIASLLAAVAYHALVAPTPDAKRY